MKSVMMWGILIVAGTASQLLFKAGLKNAQHTEWRGLSDAFLFYVKNINGYFIVGFFLAVLSFLAWLKILNADRVSTAFNISALMHITMALGACFFLGEPLGIRFIVGTLLITIGALLCV